MIIWIWIFVAVALSKLALGRQKIAFEHYVWMLLPIDMYGVTIAGATLKPYMLFCMLLALKMFIHHDFELYIGGGATKIGFLLCVLALVINIINCGEISAMMAIVLLILVYGCGLVYTSHIHESLTEIGDVICASAIGFGIVFLMAFASTQLNIALPGAVVVNDDRMSNGIVMGFGNMLDGTYYRVNRLRGFTIDPNSLNGMFMPAISICATRLFAEKSSWKNVLCFMISMGCIFASNSRTGLACALAIIIFAFLYSLPILSEERKSKVIVAFIALCFIAALALVYTSLGNVLLKKLLNTYGTRSNMTDKYGRWSVWKDAISALLDSNPWLGVGTGLIQYKTSVGLMCHNTWLEWICGCGILVGGFMVLFFVFNLILMLSKKTRYLFGGEMQIVYQAMILGLAGICISLITVDNITNSYLWFLFLTGQCFIDHAKASHI